MMLLLPSLLTHAARPSSKRPGLPGAPIYTHRWRGFVYAMNMQSGYRIWRSTVRCASPDGVYEYLDEEESPASFLSTNRWDFLTPLPPLLTCRDPAGSYTLDDFERTTWTWDLTAQADTEIAHPGAQ